MILDKSTSTSEETFISVSFYAVCNCGKCEQSSVLACECKWMHMHVGACVCTCVLEHLRGDF